MIDAGQDLVGGEAALGADLVEHGKRVARLGGGHHVVLAREELVDHRVEEVLVGVGVQVGQ